MPLVEVIRGGLSSDESVASVFALAKTLGKTPVVVKDSPGFLVNRILAPYLSEAVRLVKEGCRIEDVDRVIDATKAKRFLGWSAAVPLEEGLRETIVELRKAHAL